MDERATLNGLMNERSSAQQTKSHQISVDGGRLTFDGVGTRDTKHALDSFKMVEGGVCCEISFHFQHRLNQQKAAWGENRQHGKEKVSNRNVVSRTKAIKPINN